MQDKRFAPAWGPGIARGSEFPPLLPVSILIQRRERLAEAMRDRGLAALLVHGNPSIFGIATRSHGHLRYFCAWTDRFAPSALIVCLDRPPILLVPTPDAVARARQVTGVDDVRREDPARYGLTARRLLARLAPRERVGLAGLTEASPSVTAALTVGVPFRPLPADSILERLRLVKAPEEITRLRRAAALADRMLEVLFTQAGRRGLRSLHPLRTRMEDAARAGGAEFATAWIAAGAPPDRPRYLPEDSHVRLRPGDQILAGMYLQYQGYWGHALRMGTVGRPSPTVHRHYKRIRAVLEEAAGQIGPGRQVGTLARHLTRALGRAFPGYGGFSFRPAHGIGLDYSERPITDFFPQPYASASRSRPSPLTFAPGMVLELHPNVMDPAVAFAALGNVYLVTPTGCDSLNRFPWDLAVV